MKRGLVLGKFMPFHKGHAALIDFAAHRCDELIVLVCADDKESIPGSLRLNWITGIYSTHSNIKPVLLKYNDTELPNTSISSTTVSQIWAEYLISNIPKIDTVFSSEPYGEYLAEHMNCTYQLFDVERLHVSVSATQIRNKPFEYWDYIPVVVRPYYVKKVCLYGTESTGKTTLTARLASFFNTDCVPEMAREILQHTNDCQPYHLQQIAALHAKTINDKVKTSNKLLFVDTDLNITRSYSKFLFNTELEVPKWIVEANQVNLYLYLDNDAPYLQDGTRLSKRDRDMLNTYHQNELNTRGISYTLLQGNWNARFDKAIAVIKNVFEL